jgi:hypothetical protein
VRVTSDGEHLREPSSHCNLPITDYVTKNMKLKNMSISKMIKLILRMSEEPTTPAKNCGYRCKVLEFSVRRG